MAYASRSDADDLMPDPIAPTPPASKTSRAVAVVATLVAIVGIGVGIAMRFQKESRATALRSHDLNARRAAAGLPPEVAITSPESFAYSPHFSITGTLDPVQEARLGFNVPGRIATIAVQLGQHVEAGEVIATLDRRSIAAQSAVASAGIAANDAMLSMAQDRVTRAEALHTRGATSDAELEAARQNFALATAQLGQAHAQTRVISADGSNHILRAPFAGTITAVPSGVGNVVMPGQELFRIEDMSSLVMRTGLTERALARVAVGDAVSLEQYPSLRGEIRAFARSLDPVSRRAPVEIAFPNPNGELIGHSLVKGAVESDRPIPTMRVPGTAIRADQSVLVVDGQQHVQRRQVESLVESDGMGIVLFGLTANDRVVVRPTPDLGVGAVIRPIANRAATTAAAPTSER